MASLYDYAVPLFLVVFLIICLMAFLWVKQQQDNIQAPIKHKAVYSKRFRPETSTDLYKGTEGFQGIGINPLAKPAFVKTAKGRIISMYGNWVVQPTTRKYPVSDVKNIGGVNIYISETFSKIPENRRIYMVADNAVGTAKYIVKTGNISLDSWNDSYWTDGISAGVRSDGRCMIDKDEPIGLTTNSGSGSGSSSAGSGTSPIATSDVMSAKASICNLQPYYNDRTPDNPSGLGCAAYLVANPNPSRKTPYSKLTDTKGGSAISMPAVSITASINNLSNEATTSADVTPWVGINDLIYFGYLFDVQGPFTVLNVTSSKITFTKKYIGPNLTNSILSVVKAGYYPIEDNLDVPLRRIPPDAIPVGNKEVYVFGDYIEFNLAKAETACATFGATVATYNQMKDAYEKGAHWCWYTVVKDDVTGNARIVFPIQTSGTCAYKEKGVSEITGTQSGLACYGIKPPKGTRYTIPGAVRFYTQGECANKGGTWHQNGECYYPAGGLMDTTVTIPIVEFSRPYPSSTATASDAEVPTIYSASLITGSLYAESNYITTINKELPENLDIGDLIYISGPCNQYDTDLGNGLCRATDCKRGEIDTLRNNQCMTYKCRDPIGNQKTHVKNADGKCTVPNEYTPCPKTLEVSKSTGSFVDKSVDFSMGNQNSETQESDGNICTYKILLDQTSYKRSQNETTGYVRENRLIGRTWGGSAVADLEYKIKQTLKTPSFNYDVIIGGVPDTLVTKTTSNPTYQYPKTIGPFIVSSKPSINNILIRSYKAGDLDANGMFVPISSSGGLAAKASAAAARARNEVLRAQAGSSTYTAAATAAEAARLPGYSSSMDTYMASASVVQQGEAAGKDAFWNDAYVREQNASRWIDKYNLRSQAPSVVMNSCSTFYDCPWMGTWGPTPTYTYLESLPQNAKTAKLAELRAAYEETANGVANAAKVAAYDQSINSANATAIQQADAAATAAYAQVMTGTAESPVGVAVTAGLAAEELWLAEENKRVTQAIVDSNPGMSTHARNNAAATRLATARARYAAVSQKIENKVPRFQGRQNLQIYKVPYTTSVTPAVGSSGSKISLKKTIIGCPAGTYGDSCTPCPPGKTSLIGSLTCSNCSAGYYCPGGTAGIACPFGTYSAVNGAASCTNCPAGTYSAVNGAGSCTNCPAGTYSTAVGATSSTTCTNCPAATYSTAVGATSSTTCSPCPAGKESPQGSISSASCTSCPAGHTSNAGGLCNPCPPGWHAPLGALLCSQCPAGKYSTGGAVQCDGCPPGTFSTAVGATSSTTCVQCPAGQGSLSSATVCMCPPGQYMSGGVCYNCPAGLAAQGWGATSCTPCPAGHISNVVGTCNSCPPGWHAPLGALSCSKCPANTYSAGGAGSCTNCPADKQYSAAGAEACSLCAPGQYTWGTLCGDCGAGQTSQPGGSCTPCPAGTYSAVNRAASCTNCPAGTYSTAVGATSSTTCSPCPAGKESPQGSISSASCTPCPAGHTSNAGGLCNPCPPGWHAPPGALLCSQCPAGTYSASGATSCYNL